MIRNAYVRKIEERLDRLTREIDSVRSRAGEVTADARVRFNRQVDEIRVQAETVRKRVREVRDARTSDWGRLKKGVDEALDELKRSIDSAIQRLRKTGSDDR